MARFRKVKLPYFVLLYSLCLIIVFTLATAVFISDMKIDVPEELQGSYVSTDGAAVTKRGILIPLEAERRIVTGQEIRSLFVPCFVSVIVRATFTALFISLLLSFGFAYLLTRKIIRPIEETANNLRNIRRKAEVSPVVFPRGLSDIEDAFGEARKEIEYLYADFENLGAFLSHEQKNSLALLKAMMQNECPDLGERAIAQIDRMVKSLDDILTLSVRESEMERVDLLLVCGMAVDEYKKAYPDIFFDFDEEATLYIAGHGLSVYRAVANLIDNAVKYGQGNPVAVYVGTQRGCPYVSVRDQGIGIKMEQQEKIFESRYRIGGRKKDGYGIGLSLVRHVAELCGGFVWVDSEENRGSEFKLVFPAFAPD